VILRKPIAVAALALLALPGCPSRHSPSTAAEGPIATCWVKPTDAAFSTIRFSDDTGPKGLDVPLRGMMGHAVAFGDVNGDGWLDLFVGTFADRPANDYRKRGATGPSRDLLLRGGPNGFTQVADFAPALSRTSGAAFADLDGDGDLDLVVSRNIVRSRPQDVPSLVFRNDNGVLTQATQLPPVGGRSIGVFDYDADGRLDLFLTVDRFAGGASMLLHNDGGLKFSDSTASAGLPTNMYSLGVSVADLTGDGRPDLFVGDAQRLFVNAGGGKFRAADSSVFTWKRYDVEDMVAGVTVGDVNRDGRPDLLLGQHFKSTLKGRSIPVRLYINRGPTAGGDPRFEDVTSSAGIPSIPLKAPGVELEDYDNDGWPDILMSASTKDGSRPFILRHKGSLTNGIPRFSAVTTKPTSDTDHYWVMGTTGDIDRDGSLDVVLVEWDPNLPSVLLRNKANPGHWLEVAYGRGGGVGTVIEVRRSNAGHALIGRQEIAASHGYGAGSPPWVHFGLGSATTVDVVVRPPGGAAPLTFSNVEVDRHVHIQGTCPGR
jgi:enediyne biosynthesis protein E4